MSAVVFATDIAAVTSCSALARAAVRSASTRASSSASFAVPRFSERARTSSICCARLALRLFSSRT